MLETCGLPHPRGVDRRPEPLAPAEAGTDWPDRTLFFQWHRGDAPEHGRACAVRNQRYKLVNLSELYDLQADPAEANNIAASQPEGVAGLRQAYEAWFTDVGSKGYDPPRIHIGSKAEPLSVLTRQDWRGPRAGWTADSLGYWEVLVERAGSYQVNFEFPAADSEWQAEFQLGDVVRASAAVPAGATKVDFGQ